MSDLIEVARRLHKRLNGANWYKHTVIIRNRIVVSVTDVDVAKKYGTSHYDGEAITYHVIGGNMNLAALFGFNKKEPVVTQLDGGVVRLDIECVSCNTLRSVTVRPDAYARYKAGAYIQDAFPTHSANDRELIQSHMCAECFDGCTKEDDSGDDGTVEGQDGSGDSTRTS